MANSRRVTTNNSTFVIGGVWCSEDSLVVNQTLVFQTKFCGERTALPEAKVRWYKWNTTYSIH